MQLVIDRGQTMEHPDCPYKELGLYLVSVRSVFRKIPMAACVWIEQPMGHRWVRKLWNGQV